MPEKIALSSGADQAWPARARSSQASTERLRTIARGLAPARDAPALLDAIDKLFGDAEDDTRSNSDPGLARLAARTPAIGRAQSRKQRRVRRHRGDLPALRPAMAGLAVYPDGFQSVAKGLRQSYRGGRKALAKAFASGSDEDFHEWRKTLQHHWRHMQLLTPCWPSELSARVEISRSLSQILGDDHDIAMLQHLISAPTMSFASPDVTASFLKQLPQPAKGAATRCQDARRKIVRRAIAALRRAHRSLLAHRRASVGETRARRAHRQCHRLRRGRSGKPPGVGLASASESRAAAAKPGTSAPSTAKHANCACLRGVRPNARGSERD